VVVGIFGTMVIIFIVRVIFRGESCRDLITPSKYWGPALPKHRRLMGRYLREGQYEVNPWGDEGNVRARTPGAVAMQDINVETGADNVGYEAEKF